MSADFHISSTFSGLVESMNEATFVRHKHQKVVLSCGKDGKLRTIPEAESRFGVLSSWTHHWSWSPAEKQLSREVSEVSDELSSIEKRSGDLTFAEIQKVCKSARAVWQGLDALEQSYSSSKNEVQVARLLEDKDKLLSHINALENIMNEKSPERVKPAPKISELAKDSVDQHLFKNSLELRQHVDQGTATPADGDLICKRLEKLFGKDFEPVFFLSLDQTKKLCKTLNMDLSEGDIERNHGTIAKTLQERYQRNIQRATTAGSETAKQILTTIQKKNAFIGLLNRHLVNGVTEKAQALNKSIIPREVMTLLENPEMAKTEQELFLIRLIQKEMIKLLGGDADYAEAVDRFVKLAVLDRPPILEYLGLAQDTPHQEWTLIEAAILYQLRKFNKGIVADQTEKPLMQKETQALAHVPFESVKIEDRSQFTGARHGHREGIIDYLSLDPLISPAPGSPNFLDDPKIVFLADATGHNRPECQLKFMNCMNGIAAKLHETLSKDQTVEQTTEAIRILLQARHTTLQEIGITSTFTGIAPFRNEGNLYGAVVQIGDSILFRVSEGRVTALTTPNQGSFGGNTDPTPRIYRFGEGDIILGLTDGMTDFPGENGSIFGILEKLQEIVTSGMPPSQWLQAVYDANVERIKILTVPLMEDFEAKNKEQIDHFVNEDLQQFQQKNPHLSESEIAAKREELRITNTVGLKERSLANYHDDCAGFVFALK